MDLLLFIRLGYALIIGTFLLMVWISLCGARETDSLRYPPCYFNPLCSCSKGVPDLGIVRCHDVHLPKIPETVNISKVFMLHLENNGLRMIEPYFLQSTGLYKIVITKNPLAVISDEAFLGLERSLWELDLSYNKLTKVPNRALRYLQKLRLLNLEGNDIARINPDDWRGLQNSLKTLILRHNSIIVLPPDSFSGLPLVETIDLRGNNLLEIDPSVFRDGMGRLTNLILAENQLTAIPYQALSYLKSLKHLDISFNLINKMQPAAEVGVQNVNYNFQFNLDYLHLGYNQINTLEPGAFQYFNVLNKTYLDGNSLSEVKENAFRQAKIRELYMRNCGLKEISPLAFSGLENYLDVLDLSGNHIVVLPDGIFRGLELVRVLSLRDNVLKEIDPLDTFIGFQYTLNQLDLSGSENTPIAIKDLRRLRNLRVLSLSRLTQSSLSPEDFSEFGIDLEELIITYGGLETIKNNAFKHVHGLRKLEFSDNAISNIESNAFSDIGHSVISLKLSHALSSSMTNLPSDAIKPLINLEQLDLSNNRIKNVPETSFHFLRNLKKIYLHDNAVEVIQKGTFQGDLHYNLNELSLSFNNIRTIQQHTFVDLRELEHIHLDDNKIETIDRRGFMNLENLKVLNLKGNRIASISYEAFQNLPELEELDLSYNNMNSFDFNMFDQVGTLSMFHVNISHNKLKTLSVSSSSNFEPEMGIGGLHSNIKVLDLSHNNISLIGKQFFRPTELSLTHLYLGHNKILNVTNEVFGNMPHLQYLDVSHNMVYELDFNTFRNTRKLQFLLASNNRIAEVPNDLFRFLSNLRVVDFSHNRLNSLPDNLFRDSGLERLDVSHNLLRKLPLTSLSVASAITLCELDLSWNSISSLSHGGMLSRFKSLSWLDLSYNRLAQIDAGTFKGLPRLSTLNLGHNGQLTLEPSGQSFQGLEYTILHLNLDNVSLSHIPTLPTPHLLTLSLAHNSLPTVAPEIAGNISRLTNLNIDYNDLSAVPIVTHSLTELRYLSMAGNPITAITNTSLLGLANNLEELDLREINLSTFETGAFCKLYSLRTLRVSLYRNLKNFNIPRMLQYSSGLRNLEINVYQETDSNLENELTGVWPNKLRNITFTGKGFKQISARIFQGVRSPYFHLGFQNTSILKISSEIFKNMAFVRNISIDARNNPELKNLLNPSTGSKPNLPRRTFLTDVKLAGSKWSCDCDLGWVEVWLRKRRQYFCKKEHGDDIACREADDEFRTTLCANKNNQSLIDVLKTDIECGWSKGSSVDMITIRILMLFQLTFMLF